MCFSWIPLRKKGWRLYDLEKREFFVSRDVVFSEFEFPFGVEVTDESKEEEWVPLTHLFIEEEEARTKMGRNGNGPNLNPGPPSQISSAQNHNVVGINPETQSIERTVPPEVPEEEIEPAIPLPTQSTTEVDGTRLGRGCRQRAPSVKLKNFVVEAKPQKTKSQQDKSSYPMANYVDCKKFSPQHQAYLAAINSGVEPKSFREAMEDDKWKEAMSGEIDAQERNHSWTVEDLPKGKKAIGCKWVYKLKYKSDGSLERHKARLVALGNKQIEGVDYGETLHQWLKWERLDSF